VQTDDGAAQPALVVQPFGRGRTAAMLVGDMWRWHLRRKDAAQSDLERSWRQMVRWLVADVPQRVEVETTPEATMSGATAAITVWVRDERFEPLDDATVEIRVKTPDGREIELTAQYSERNPGEYQTTFSSRLAGCFRAEVLARAADGSEVGRRETGWTNETATDEFRTLRPNRTVLEHLATATGGELVAIDALDQFVGELPNRKVPIVETWTFPLWHQWPCFLLAIGCVVAEWGLRRWKGLP
jgi:hypothetical protein